MASNRGTLMEVSGCCTGSGYIGAAMGVLGNIRGKDKICAIESISFAIGKISYENNGLEEHC